MVDWRPIVGIIPPIGDSAWAKAFDAYKQFPEYKLVNRGMDLAEFKFIFYMEYFHRVLGRLIGIAFIIPFFIFLIKGGLPAGLKRGLWILLALGACQGLMGWFMVKSGLVSDPHVSQYRLTAHLILAVVIFAMFLRLICGLIFGDQKLSSSEPQSAFNARATSFWVFIIIILMIVTGGFMAGTRAGYIYNSWPKMGQDWMPEMVWSLIPWWKNLFENPLTIQFVHRWLAFAVLLSVLYLAIRVIRHESRQLVGGLAMASIAVVGAQVVLGITTLLGGVPIALGIAHQGTALILLGLIVAIWSAYLPEISHGRTI